MTTSLGLLSESTKPTICVDFDGVLNVYTGDWRGALAPIRLGVDQFLRELKRRGYSVVILTARSPKQVADWLHTWGIESLVDEVTNIKVPAVAYIDDRALIFRGDFSTVLDDLATFRPYWMTPNQDPWTGEVQAGHIPPLKVAISGKMTSGKTTLRRALQEAHPQVPYDSLARPLREAAKALGFAHGETIKDRSFLQDIAGYVLSRNDTQFVELLDKRHPDLDQTGLIVDDLRRTVELAYFRRAGFLTVRLLVSRETQLQRGAQPERMNHFTETELDDVSDFDLFVHEGERVSDITYAVLDIWRRRYAGFVDTPLELRDGMLTPRDLS